MGTRLPPALEKQTRGEATKRCLCADIPRITDGVCQLHTPCSAPNPVWFGVLFCNFSLPFPPTHRGHLHPEKPDAQGSHPSFPPPQHLGTCCPATLHTPACSGNHKEKNAARSGVCAAETPEIQ